MPEASCGYFGVPTPTSPCAASLIPVLGVGTPHSHPDPSHPTPCWLLHWRGLGACGHTCSPGSVTAVPPHPGLPADTLQGHRDRFHEQFRR